MTTKQPGNSRNGTALPEFREAIPMIDPELNDGERLATAREYVLELLFALDEKQITHHPRPHAEIVEILHDLLDLVDDSPVKPVNPLAEYLRILKDPANDDDHPGGTAA